MATKFDTQIGLTSRLSSVNPAKNVISYSKFFIKKINHKVILANIILLGCCYSSKGTNFDNTLVKYKNSANFYIGFSYYNNPFASNLNSLLHDMKADEIINSGVGFMYGLVLEKKRFAIGVEWSSPILSSKKSNSESKTTVSTLLIKYDVLRKRTFAIYPQIGFGAVEIQHFIYTNPNNISVTQSYSNGGNTFSVANQSVFLNAAIGFEHYTQDKFSPLITYKIGFNFATSSTKWFSPLGSFSDAPSDKISNIYFQLAFGLKARDAKLFPYK